MKQLLTILIFMGITYSMSYAFSGKGSGSISEPFQISTAEQLRDISNSPTSNYKQTADIDLSAYPNWTVIGINFSGIYDGNYHKITGLTITSTSSSKKNYGLFVSSSGTIQNLGIEAAKVAGSISNIGILVGFNSGTILNCYTTGTISNNGNSVGGLVGYNKGGTIINCYSTANVEQKETSYINAGGLVGNLTDNGKIQNCYSTGLVKGANSIGGLIGAVATGTTITNCFWDTITSRQTSSKGSEIGKTTKEMKTASTFNTWSSNDWIITEGNYPVLAWQPLPPTVTTGNATTVTSTEAVLNGTVNANKSSTTISFEYGTSNSYGSVVTATQSPVTDSKTTTVSASITGLTANTTYHFRIKGINSTGSNYGDDQTFTTLAIAPTITTQAVTNISTTTAMGNGNITNLGVPNPTQYGVVWSTTENPTISLTTLTLQGEATEKGAFSSNISGLSPNTKYYIKAYATNTAGTIYGEEISFTTTPDNEKPVITGIPSNITTTNESGKNYATISWTEPTASDNVKVTSFTSNYQPGTQFPVGTTTIIYTAKDAAGNSASGSFTITVTSTNNPLQTPEISWVTPEDISYGTPLGAKQLSATATIAGTFTYYPPIGTILNAGTAQNLTVQFTPTDDQTYGSASKTVTINVTKAELTATANNQSTIKKHKIPELTITYNGFVNGDNASVLDEKPIASTSATEESNVGDYSITPKGGSDNNYYFTYIKGTLSITDKQEPTIKWATPADITYGTALNANQLNASTTIAGTFNYTPAIGTILNAGTTQALTVQFLPTDNDSYTSASHTVNINVLKAALTVTATNKTTHLGQSIPSLTWTYNGFVNGEDPTVLNKEPVVTTTATSESGVGEYPIIPSGGTDNNYNFTYEKGTLTIADKETPTIQWTTPADITYGTALSTNQLNANTTVDGTFAYNPAAGTVLNAGGAQSLTVKFTPKDTKSYESTSKTISINVNKAPLIIKANCLTINKGSEIPTLTFTYSGFVNNDNASVIDTEPTITTTAIPESNAGDYLITPSGGLDDNYSFTYIKATLCIKDKQLPIIKWTTPLSITYGTALGTTQLNATSTIPGTFSYTPAEGEILNAGNAQKLTVEFTPTDMDTYGIVSKSVNIYIKKAKLTATANKLTITKGSEIPTLTYTYNGFVNGDDASVLDIEPTATTTATSDSPVGSYPISLAEGSDDNYSFTYVKGSLTIKDKQVPIIKWLTPAAITYGTVLGTAQLNASSTIPGTFSYTPSEGETLNAGIKQTINVLFTPTDTINYTHAEKTVYINVNKAKLTVTANKQFIFKGNEIPELTYTYSGFVNGDDATALDVEPSATTTATRESNAGKYTITLSDGSDDNYNFVYVKGLLTIIEKKVPSIKWNIPADFSYGTALGTPQLNATSTVPGTFSYSPAEGEILNAGNNQTLNTHFIPTDTTNYTSADKSVKINVSKAIIIITGQDQTITQGSEIPTLKFTYDGFVNHEDESVLDILPEIATQANKTSKAGNYEITLSGAMDNNYDFVYESGTLKITPSTAIETKNITPSIVAPNPATDHVTITNEKPSTGNYTILSVSGDILKQGLIKDLRTTVNIKTLKAGIYMLRITTKENSQSFRIIKL